MMIGRRIGVLLGLLFVGDPAHAASTAGSAPLFTVTDLGPGFHLQQDATGWTHGVTDGDGSQTYAFDKSPVWYNPAPFSLGRYNYNYGSALGSYALFDDSGKLQDYEVVATNGTHQISYRVKPESDSSSLYAYSTNNAAPSYEWAAFRQSPVKDLNASGETVGIVFDHKQFGRDYGSTGPPGDAGFTEPNGQLHWRWAGNIPDLVGDDLNGWISQKLGVHLTVGLKVDDLGRIIAEGTLNGVTQDFLLTPPGLPSPAPEPSTLALLGLVAAAFGLRRARRRA